MNVMSNKDIHYPLGKGSMISAKSNLVIDSSI